MKNVIAIDPGAVSGAFAIFRDGKLEVGDLPGVDGQINAAALACLVRGLDDAIVEQVGPMPKQGLSSTFRFGVAVGIIRGVLVGAGISTRHVPPTVWKKHFSLLGKDKEASRALAIQRHPTVQGLELKKHHGRAEALLMLDWYTEKRP